MKPVDEKAEKVVIRAVSRDEEGKKKEEKVEVKTRNLETIKYVEKKLIDKGVMRMERHPVDGLGGIGKPPPKSGRGGKYTWEGPEDLMGSEMDPVPPAVDEHDPNYVDEDAEKGGLENDGLVVGEVEVAKVVEGRGGVGRLEVDSHLNLIVDDNKANA